MIRPIPKPVVFIVVHDDSVRGVYVNRADAEAARISRTPRGARSRAYDAHSEACCEVIERDIEWSRPSGFHGPTLDWNDYESTREPGL